MDEKDLEHLAADVDMPATPEKQLPDEGALDVVQSYRNQLQRLQADFANYRKRVARDRDKERREAENRVLLDLLLVLVHLDQGLQQHGGEPSDPVVQGLELIRGNFLKTLDAWGTSPLETEGVFFDPNWHEAVGCRASTEHPEGEVIEDVRRGYMRNGLLLRPARAIVSGGSVSTALENEGE